MDNKNTATRQRRDEFVTYIRARFDREVAHMTQAVKDAGYEPDATAIRCQVLADLEHDVVRVVSDLTQELRAAGFDIPVG